MKDNRENEHSVLALSFQMGTLLLESGAEISRIQETMERVAKSCRVDAFNVYVLTNTIFANGVEDGIPRHMQMKYVSDPKIHIGRISAVNQLSREIVSGKTDVEAAFARLEEIRRIPFSRLPLALLCCGVGCACFGFMRGGTAMDLLSAFLCGIGLEAFLHFIRCTRPSKFIVNLSASFFAALLACVLYLLSACDHLDIVVTASIVRLVPGVALTTSIRDFFNGDYLSGTIRMIDALIVGACIAIGVGSVIMLFSLWGGNILL